MKKDSVKKHVQNHQHQEAQRIQTRSEVGAIPYQQSIITSTPIGRGLQRMAEKDEKNMRVKFNSAYYLAKKERPFRDYPDLLKLQTKNNIPKFGESYNTDRAAAVFTDYIGKAEKDELFDAISKGSYFSVLTDGSTDTSVQEQELIYVLFVDEGKPRVAFLDIETPKSADAGGIYDCIVKAFTDFGIENFHERLVGINADGASVNMGTHTGVATRLKETAPWLLAIHCFNHRLELAVQDAFKGIKAFEDIDELLLKLYYYYQKSPKRLRDLRSFAEEFDHSVPKPVDNPEMQGFLNKWCRARIPFELAVYLDILSPSPFARNAG